MNRGYFAQHLSLGNRGVVPGHGIAARDALRAALLDQAMNEEPLVARDQHDVTGNGSLARLALDAENIARPDGWQHAGSQSLQAYRTARSENFGCKIEFVICTILGHEWHGGSTNSSD